ncbi:Proline iminopeptidase [Phytophthora cinnamomi]|nr:Proline iminopeptidase [Phytophthora cinnamomi]
MLPPVLPHELAQLSPAEFVELLRAHAVTSRGTLTDADIIAIREEHELLRRNFTENEDIRYALEKCAQDTSFDVAWSLVDCRFKTLEAFAGGLATVRPLDTVAFSDQRARDLVVCTKELEEARLLLADFELESALHAQQLQSLTKLQEEIYDRKLSENRSRLVHALQRSSETTN